MNDLEIENNVPIPDPTSRGRQGEIATMARKMKPGDSVLFRGAESRGGKGVSALCQYFYRNNLDYVQRKTEDGIRVWRT